MDQDGDFSAPRTDESPSPGEFTGYDKIAESSAGWPDDCWKRLRQVKWCATEKVHGANFCFVVSNFDLAAPEVRCANRQRLLADNDNFFDFQEVVRRINEQVIATGRLFRATQNPPPSRVFIFGELFGGGYPHKDVPANPRVRPVQTGIWYSPNIEFMAFDIAFELESESSDPTKPKSTRQYADYETALSVFAKAKLFHAEPLVIGKYESVMDYPNKFDSTIPKRLGLPSIGPNLSEGLVFKPLKNVMLSTPKGQIRAAVKNKIDEFREDKRFHGAQKWDAPGGKSDAAKLGGGDFSGGYQAPAVDELTWEAQAFITEQRIHNSLSKIGHVDPSNKARLKELFDLYVKDVEDQLKDTNEEKWKSLTDAEKKSIGLVIRKDTAELLKTYFKIPPKAP